MNKVLKRVICVLISTFLFLDVIKAASIEVAGSEVYANKTENSVTMTIKGTELTEYSKIEFDLSVPDSDEEDGNKVKVDSVSLSEIKSGTTFSTTNAGWSIKNEEGLEEELIFTISFTTYQINSNFTITPVNVWLYKEGEEPLSLTSNSIKVGTIKYLQPVSDDASLEELNISDGVKSYSLTPEFDKEIKEYTLDLSDDVSFINISVKAANKAKFVGNGRKTLIYGKNEFEIKVTAEDNTTTKIYKLTVYRGDVSDPSPYLSSIKIKTEDCTLSPEFDKKNNKYTVNAPYGTTKLDIEYVSEDRNAVVLINGNDDFEVGENTVTIKVTSSDEKESQEYELIVNVDKENTNKPAPPIEPQKEEDKKPSIFVIIGIISGIVLIVGFLAFILFKKRRRKKNRKQKEVITDNNVKEETKYYDDEKTSTYDINSFKEVKREEEIEKTKEYHFDFRDNS